MSKGRYAARAANREAARDNELLVEKLAEIESLTTELADAKRQLAEERRERGAIIVRRVEEQVAEQIRQVHSEMTALTESYAEEKRFLAQTFTDHFHARGIVPDFWMGGVLPLLIPDAEERSKYVVDVLEHDDTKDFAREDRRGAAGVYERVLKQRAQAALKGYSGRVRPGRKTPELNEERHDDE